MHRFFINQPLQSGELTTDNQDLIHQLKDVLRLQKGNSLILLDGSGLEAPAEVVELHKKRVAFSVDAPTPVSAEPKRRVTLYVSILKRGNFELAIQKATECGVAEIVPVISERTEKTGLRRERLRRILKEATEQSGRGVIPKLHEPLPLADALTETKRHDLTLFFDPSGENMPGKLPDNIGVFVGSEGGWTTEELEQAKEFARIVTLGELTLRAETAAVVASYLAMHSPSS